MKPSANIITLICTGIFFIVPLGALAEEQKDGLEVLKSAEEKMRELAEEDLPNLKVGKETQDKEEAVIQAFDELIQMIADAKAQQEQEGQKSKKGQQQQQQKQQQKDKQGEQEKKEGEKQEGSEQSEQLGGETPASMQMDTPPEPAGMATGQFGGPRDGRRDDKSKDEWGFLPDKDFDPTAKDKASKSPLGYQKLLNRFHDALNREERRFSR